MGQIGSEVGQDQHWAPGICVHSLLLPVLPCAICMCLFLPVYIHGSGGLISVRRTGLCITIGVANVFMGLFTCICLVAGA